MSDPELVEAEACNLAELLRAQGPPSIPWTGLKSDLNRDGEALGRDYMSGQGVPHPHRGFAWRSDDRKTKKWRPQGITLLSRDSSDRAAVVCWYSSIEGDKGVRLSFVALEGDARYKYRHVLLVRPSNDGKLFEPGGPAADRY